MTIFPVVKTMLTVHVVLWQQRYTNTLDTPKQILIKGKALQRKSIASFYRKELSSPTPTPFLILHTPEEFGFGNGWFHFAESPGAGSIYLEAAWPGELS